MGDNASNFHGNVHIMAGAFQEITVIHHFGDVAHQGAAAVDTSRTATTAEAAALHTAAAGTQSSFDSTASPIFGSGWYAARPSDWKADLHSWCKATDFAAL